MGCPDPQEPALEDRKVVQATMMTLTWSVHQYQVAMMVRPKVIPVHGRSPVKGSRNMCIASARGKWQVVLVIILDGMARA